MKPDLRVKKRIPYAVANFEQMREENYYFVDKTKYIQTLEDYTAPVFLRPRRFGKTLWCSILECYYDINRAHKFDALFGGTYIGENPTPEKSSMLVMRFNFSVVSVSDNGNEIKQSFDGVCEGAMNIFLTRYAEYFPDFDRAYLDATRYLEKIIDYIQEHNLPPLYLIIDEYDNFTNQLITTHQEGLYTELTTGDSFLRTFFKAIKAGTESQAVRHVYITGVLPVTIDDLTSGFNIAKIITLKKKFVNMLGFTQTEVDDYLEMVRVGYGYEQELIELMRVLLKNYYNGYHFAEGSESIYNSTILTYFVSEFTEDGGEFTEDFIDPNLKTDIRWIKRLTIHESDTTALLEEIALTGELTYDRNNVKSKFNLNTFFEKEFYPISLFYLGMLTFKDSDSMVVPNQTMRTIFMEYFNEVEHYNVSGGYEEYFRRFRKDLDLENLFSGYWKVYVGQIPAQAFDKVNENFIRTTFYELCRRHLSLDFAINIEVNYPCGRSDWELLGKPHTKYKNIKQVVEFKHFSVSEGQRLKIMQLEEPFEADVAQVTKYAEEILKDFPQYKLTRYIVYTIGNREYRVLRVRTPDLNGV